MAMQEHIGYDVIVVFTLTCPILGEVSDILYKFSENIY